MTIGELQEIADAMVALDDNAENNAEIVLEAVSVRNRDGRVLGSIMREWNGSEIDALHFYPDRPAALQPIS